MDPIEAQRRKLEQRLQKKKQREAEESGGHAALARVPESEFVDDADVEDLDDDDLDSDDALDDALDDASLDDLDDLDLDDDDDGPVAPLSVPGSDVGELDSDVGELDSDLEEIESDLDELEELSDADFEQAKPASRGGFNQPDGVDFSKIAGAVPGLEGNLDEPDELPAGGCPTCAETQSAKAELVRTLGKILVDLLSEGAPTPEQRAAIRALKALGK